MTMLLRLLLALLVAVAPCGAAEIRVGHHRTLLSGKSAAFDPRSLFAAGEQGVIFDPSDLSTMFQDAAGATPVTGVEQPVGLIRDLSGRGNHATQSTAGSRPVLSARVNLLTSTDALSTQSVTTVATTYTLAFSGSSSITLSGTATGTYSAGSSTITATAGTLTLTVSGTVTNADLRPTNVGVNLPAYQRVNTSTDYDTVGFPYYLRFDGVDDSLSTAAINLSSTSNVSYWIGLTKESDSAWKWAFQFGNPNTASSGTFGMTAPENLAPDYGFYARGSSLVTYAPSGYAAPITSVASCTINMSGAAKTDVLSPRVNGVLKQSGGSGTTTGATVFGNYALSLSFNGVQALNGRIYSLIVRGAASTAKQIADTEAWVNARTRAY